MFRLLRMAPRPQQIRLRRARRSDVVEAQTAAAGGTARRGHAVAVPPRESTTLLPQTRVSRREFWHTTLLFLCTHANRFVMREAKQAHCQQI